MGLLLILNYIHNTAAVLPKDPTLASYDNFDKYTSFCPYALVVPSLGIRVAVAESLNEWCDLLGMKLNVSKTK